ncbi:ABC transporter substrate-binding protein [candidate division KSB3 bacterium]|uniref:ABC transporter substrate-binding protein n=1 Tax=candidate division KSB3 bacterium TaxID=2044937 RepID=A0A9D5Q5B4_9BACT|nr:ABC transporter substrate-binding protein [candidate division KSB3 bacterium]MBD3324435.1 ABC transporter substrate-binding protein [candidate division KSB3 bacterium]
MRKLSIVVLCVAFLVGTTSAFAEVKNPDTFIKATYGTLRTLDPAVSYDTTGAQRIENIYDRLIHYDGPHTDQFVPALAVEVPTIENGGISEDGMTYMFTIREGVKFHEGGDLTAEDVEYSLERHMICDPDGGPMWMMLEALTGAGGTRDGDGNVIPGMFENIMDAVERDGNTIIIHLPMPYPPLMGILAQSWAAILDKEWAIEQGCWDGTLETAAEYNNPAPGHEPLQKLTNGTGPYMMKAWEPSKEFVFERFEGYWGPQPALKTAIFKYVPEWSTRKLMLMNGDADYVTVDATYVPEMAGVEGIKTYEVPQLSVSAAMFCQNIRAEGNPNIGSGQLDGEGVPPDFFSDINVRKAFMHAFDRDLYREDVLQNIDIVPTNPNVEGLPYAIDVPVYEFDLQKTEEYLKQAWDGQVWENGFKMTIAYNTGNAKREGAALMLKEYIESLNPKFQIEVQNVDWKDYLVAYRNFMYPIFIIGWGADYADPHNFLYTFMHSEGVYGKYMAYANEEVDNLCDQGIATTDPAKRAEIYERLQHLWYEEAIGLCIYQTNLIRHYRDWVQGFVPNPMDTEAAEWLYRLSKEEQ